MIVLNFKTYHQSTQNNNATNLAKTAQNVFEQFQIPIIVCVQATDIYKVAKQVKLPVYAQHLDPYKPGKHTGYISALAIKENNATGTLLNHSEHRINNALEKTIRIAKIYKLKTIVCVENKHEAKKIDDMGVDMIALEDPELIGGNLSIVESQKGRQKIKACLKLDLKAKFLIGAGIKGQKDVHTSIKLGADGVLIASGFVKARDPETVLKNLCRSFIKI